MRSPIPFCVKSIVIGMLVVLAYGCTSNQLVTRKNHRHDHDYCWQRIIESDQDAFSLTNKLERDVILYQISMEEALMHRELGVNLINTMKREVSNDAPVPPWMLEKLNIGMSRGLELTDRVVSHIASNECWLQATDKRLANKNLKSINPYTRFKGFLVAFSATLSLYDTYYTTVYVLNNDRRIRQFLNRSDHGYGRRTEQLQAVTDTIFNTANIQLVKDEIQFYEDHLPIYMSQIEKDSSADYLNTLIRQSPTYPIIRSASLESIQQQQEMLASAQFDDSLSELGRDATNEISKFFGNLVGLVEERKGKLYQDKDTQAHLSRSLQAGDILLEKTPFRLTDKLIPGHWGHAAIWIGTKSELESLGIWEHPLVRVYHKKILQEKSVVEALRSGVEMNSLSQFMNIDDIAILRDPHKTKLKTTARILRSLRQVGKSYDFNYDVETTDKIVCSQLVYIAYANIQWPTEKVMGRYTISPDNIAKKAIKHGPLKLVELYHDGKRIDAKPESFLQTLLQTDR